MLLALCLLAAAPARPPARLAIPGSLRRQRGSVDLLLPPSMFEDPGVMQALGPLRAQPGAWAEYAIRTRGAGGVRARLSILPGELPQGRFWLEVNAISQDAPPSSVRLLLRGTSLAQQDIERAIVWITGQAPIELPVDQVPPLDPKDAPRTPAARVRRGPPETVQVGAGTFAGAETLRVGDTRIWRSARVPLWGLVKAQSPRQTLELTASGQAGAHTAFPPGWGDGTKAQGNGSESTK